MAVSSLASSLMSTPAQNPRPSAESTTHCTRGSRPSSSTERASSNQPALSNALTGGWSNTRSATPESEMRMRKAMGSSGERAGAQVVRVEHLPDQAQLLGRGRARLARVGRHGQLEAGVLLHLGDAAAGVEGAD